MRSNFPSELLFFICFFNILGCGKTLNNNEDISSKNYVQSGDVNTNKIIGDQDHHFTILGNSAFHDSLLNGTMRDISNTNNNIELDNLIDIFKLNLPDSDNKNYMSTSPDSLLFGLPYSLLNEPMLFGSAVIQISDHENTSMGNLKLADLPPLHVKPLLHKNKSHKYVLAIVSCGSDCSNISDPQVVIDIPVIGISNEDSDKKVILDLSTLGNTLELTSIRQGDPILENYISQSSKVVRFDFSKSTLVFDIETYLVPHSNLDSDSRLKDTIIKNRWYLKSEKNSFNTHFISREPSVGVGYFLTERSEKPLIQRWDFETPREIKYYIKNVPPQFHDAFSAAFDQWNEHLSALLGKSLFSYEFLNEHDSRNELIISGDPRYNVIEWDLANKTVYGGLGPSFANQFTGEIFHANVLVQGPTIVEIYSKWFKTKEITARLAAQGDIITADFITNKIIKEIQQLNTPSESSTFQLKFGPHFSFRIRSQQPSLEDPVIDKTDFDPLPEGYSFQNYMNGYFQDMVEHELGHNLGLRHNFKGSLGATGESPSLGKVSRSVMEYLDRNFRYLDRIGEYDLMAISYGYLGVKPKNKHWYCTDEDLANLSDPNKSPECSKTDSTNDPFSYFQFKLSRAIDLLIAKGKTSPPDWTVDEMKNQLKSILTGLGSYSLSASNTFSDWTNFSNYLGRPQNALEVHPYVLNTIKALLCDHTLNIDIESKETLEGKTIAQSNLEKLRKLSVELLQPIFSESDLACSVRPL